MRASFVRLEWENQAHTIASFYFQPAGPGRYRYEAGQYAVLHISHLPADNRGDERTLTLSSSPDEALLKFTVRLLRDKGSSFKRALLGLQPGAQVTIYDALGDLVLPLDASIPLVFVAGGLGVVSFVGMTRWLTDRQEQRNIKLLYAVNKTDDIIMQSTFDDYLPHKGLTKTLYISNSHTTPEFQGDIVNHRLGAIDINPHITPESLIYLSGPEQMVQSLLKNLQALGVSNQQLIFDYFD